MLVRGAVAVGVLALVGCSGLSDPQAGTTVAVGAAPTVPPDSASTEAMPAGPAPPSSTATSAPDPVTPQGYRSVRATVTEADGEVCELCVWLADTPALRRRGLMQVTDLGEGVAMAFVYPAPHTGSFWMMNTPMPLSIAFFAADGVFLDAFDMDPCVGRLTCPSYPTPPDFTVAIEAPQGGLAELGIDEGSTLELTDLPCR